MRSRSFPGQETCEKAGWQSGSLALLQDRCRSDIKASGRPPPPHTSLVHLGNIFVLPHYLRLHLDPTGEDLSRCPKPYKPDKSSQKAPLQMHEPYCRHRHSSCTEKKSGEVEDSFCIFHCSTSPFFRNHRTVPATRYPPLHGGKSLI